MRATAETLLHGTHVSLPSTRRLAPIISTNDQLNQHTSSPLWDRAVPIPDAAIR